MTYAVELSRLIVRLGEHEVLAGVDLLVDPGEIVAIEGTSGSGKSTLLHAIAGLITPESGAVMVAGDRVDDLSERSRSALRLRRCGSVFQFGELVPELNLIENVELPLRLLGLSRGNARVRASAALEEVGLDGLEERSVAQVSGGQMQRAAIARAVVHDPDVILADEPTGALDDDTAGVVMELLIETTRRHHAGTIVVTHDRNVSSRCDRSMCLVEGVLGSPAPSDAVDGRT